MAEQPAARRRILRLGAARPTSGTGRRRRAGSGSGKLNDEIATVTVHLLIGIDLTSSPSRCQTEPLLELICRKTGCDPGADSFPAYLRPQTAQHNAATALVRVCSSSAVCGPDVPMEHGRALPAGGNLRSLVEVALKRLTQVCAHCTHTAAHISLSARLGGVTWPWAP